MKKFIAALIVLIAIFSAMGLLMAPVYAANPVVPNGSLTVVTHYGEAILQGIEIEIYLIADGSYTNGVIHYAPKNTFSSAPNFNASILNTEMSAEEHIALAARLKAFAAQKNISATRSGITDANGQVVFDNLTPGLYLVVQKAVSDTSSPDHLKYNMTSFIVAVPTLEKDIFNTNIVSKPKFEEAKGTVTVLKRFSQASDEPADSTQFTVVLMQNRVTKYTFTLNRANNWTFSADVVYGTYDVAEVSIPGSYQFVSLSHTQIAVNTGKGPTITATNRKASAIPPTSKDPETTTPEPTTSEESTPPDTTAPKPTTPEPSAAPTTTKHGGGGNQDGDGGNGGGGNQDDQGQNNYEPGNRATFPSYEAERVTDPVVTIAPPKTESSRIALPNGWFAEDLGNNLFMIYDENGVPLGYVQLSDGDSIETYDVVNNLIPLDRFAPTTSANIPAKSNPKTGDIFIFTLFGLSIFGCIIAVIAGKKRQKDNKIS